MAITSNKTLKKYFDQKFNDARKNLKLNLQVSKYFGEIGSTQIEDIFYKDQLAIKKEALHEIFSNEELKLSSEVLNNFEIIKSPKIEEYRFRMDFVCSFNPFYEPHERMGQRKRKRFNFVVDMDECNLIPRDIFKKVRSIYEYAKKLGLRDYDLVKHDGELRYLVVKGINENNLMINLVSKSKDCEDQIDQIAEFAKNLGIESFNWILNESIGDSSEGEVYKYYSNKTIEVDLHTTYNTKRTTLKVGANTFFQNNISCFEKILDFTLEFIAQSSLPKAQSILYDLYSGVGTFGICLAEHFEKVIGFEINSESVELAKQNVEINNLKNIEYSQQDLNIIEIPSLRVGDTKNYKLPTTNFLIVDPPRTGLQKNGVEHVIKLNADIVIYVSCNPITQMQDLIELQKYYEIKEMKAFDMFPHTYHLENVVILKKINNA